MKESICPAHQGLQLLQEKWVLHIVNSLLRGPRGFNELSRAVRGCNPTTLAHRLERLESAGLLTKTVCSTMPPRTKYELTEGGRALEPVLDAIDRWASTYLPEEQSGKSAERQSSAAERSSADARSETARTS